jgi:6-phospho-beta-glucosidase
MNIVFVGGGSFRTLPIVRAAMKDKSLFQNGKIWLVDFNLSRAETVGRLIMKTPEYAGTNCEIKWTDNLDKALPGADIVSISFPVGSLKVCRQSEEASVKKGFIGSDQISLSGAFRSLTGGVVILNIAKKMEKYCPDAWLVTHANPVAVYSGMVNNHTKIKALGVCSGINNHRWDLTRLIFDKDEYSDEFKVSVAGINHCSFILRGAYRNKDIYKLIDESIDRKGWQPCHLTKFKSIDKSVRESLKWLAEMRRRFGIIIFSTEWDGMAHIFFEEIFNYSMKNYYKYKSDSISQVAGGYIAGNINLAYYKKTSVSQIEKLAKDQEKERQQQDMEFRSYLDKELDTDFWAKDPLENPHFAAYISDPIATVITAVGGNSKQWLAASFPNRGAVKGFKDRTVLEYSMLLDKEGVHPDHDLEVPDCFHGLISSLATHQTLLGDAIATSDPKIFAEALFAYPVYQNTQRAKSLWKELLKIHAKEIPDVFQKAEDYF